MEINTSRTIGSFKPDRSKIYSSLNNDYIPFYTEYPYVSIPKSLSDIPEIFYYTPDLKNAFFKSNSIKNILNALEKSLYAQLFEINSNTYFIWKGVIFNSSFKPVLVLAIKKEVLLVDIPIYTEKFDPKNLVLFYASEFFTDKGMELFHRRLQKTVLLSCFTKGIEVKVLSIDSIEKNTFARILKPPFRSVSELDYHLKNVLPLFLKGAGEDTDSLENKSITYETEESYLEIEQPLSLEEEAVALGYGEPIQEVVPPPYIAGIDPLNEDSSTIILTTQREGTAQEILLIDDVE